jgi:ribose transport system ATP-binding protein
VLVHKVATRNVVDAAVAGSAAWRCDGGAVTATITTKPAASVTGLRIRGLSKNYPGTVALDGVDVDVPAGRIHALLGGNGSGKSTLVKILAGVETGDPGGVLELSSTSVASDRVTPAWARASGLAFVHQDLGLFERLTVAENLYAGQPYPRRHGHVDWRAMRHAADRDLARFGIRVRAGALVGELRPVEQTLVAVVRALRTSESAHDRILVLDEPTARLPRSEVDRLLEALRGYAAQGQTVVYVSHRLDEVLQVADSVTVLRDGRHVTTRSTEGLSESELATLIAGDRLPATARRGIPAVATRAAALELRGLSGRTFGAIDLRVCEAEVVGLAGLVGSGRTNLLETVFGVQRGDGTIMVGGRELPPGDVRASIAAGLAYVPENRAADSAFLNLGIPENLSAAASRRYRRGLRYHHRAERDAAAGAIRTYGIRTPAVTALLSQLSGGNQQKTMLARWLDLEPKVLLLDEPTQGVDVGARADIYGHVRAAVAVGSAALVASSDLRELLELADRILVLSGGRVTLEAPAADLDEHSLTEHIYGTTREDRR